MEHEGRDAEADLTRALDEAPLDVFHLRAVLTAGMGFFTDAYDLFIIGAALVLIKGEWHPGKALLGLLGSTALAAAFLGAFVFGRIADRYGRKKVYGLEAGLMAAGALLSAFAPNILWLIAFRFVLGVGVGGDYPVSAVLMSEYANIKDRGRLVGLVFSMQALGLLAGPVVALTLVNAGLSPDLAWRLMLGLGAIPAAAVIWFRRRLPESPRFQARVLGQAQHAARELETFTGGQVRAGSRALAARRLPVADLVRQPRMLLTLAGTAGTWFLFDYAYYGNSISTPFIMKLVAPHAALPQAMAWTLIIFAVFALPGYIAAFTLVDRIGHRRLQLWGFAVMGLAFLAIAVLPGVTRHALPFLLLYGASYFFAEFGPNTTTFILASELYPASLRTTAHGISSGVAKFGAFLGVFVFPLLSAQLGLNGTLFVAFLFSVAGFALTLVLPEPSGRSIEELGGDREAEIVPARQAEGRRSEPVAVR
ncbi:MFS transporter [Candidatus Hydrogenisulfobacillus filiaventi]|uniref:MFS transporter n=1 Tax=Candidatus Hydrogenisulfobacillus filiaventi TaxID=2707344 RepID=A0A6F8ZJV4_9FIRM|nr:MFS transporter [Bacillota bacterium]CAB1129880.1 MFS transporter [Candidatus Hydrogenisulfobacillus filiaventi]